MNFQEIEVLGIRKIPNGLNFSDPAVSGDNTQLRSLASVAVKINQHV